MTVSTEQSAPAPLKGYRLKWWEALAVGVVAHSVAWYLKLCFATTKWEWIGRDHFDVGMGGPRVVVAVWHARICMLIPFKPKGRETLALVSANRDGEYLARMLAASNVGAVRGSSRDPRKADKNRGGHQALPELAAAVRRGGVTVVTPDGPRGPRMRAKVGAAALSAAADAPVMPMALSVKRARIFKSWDRFMLPLPFTRGVVAVGTPIQPAEEQDRAQLELRRADVERALNELTRAADARLGRETPEPGPEPQINDAADRGATSNAAGATRDGDAARSVQTDALGGRDGENE